MTVYFAGDHAGFELKRALIEWCGAHDHTAEDMGAHTLVEEDDYPDYVIPLAHKVAAEHGAFGVVMGKSGQGEAMAANRVPGARAALFYGGSFNIIRLAREHNDANILSIGAGFVSPEEATEALRLFLETPFSNEDRHLRRLAKF